MKIKLGDTIRDERGREGVITNIGIATDPTDIGGELGVNAKEYDTDLNYMLQFFKSGCKILKSST